MLLHSCARNQHQLIDCIRQSNSNCFSFSFLFGILAATLHISSRDSAVGIATGCGLDDGGVGVRVPVGSGIFSSQRSPDRLWGPPSILPNVYWVLCPLGEADHSPPNCAEVKKTWLYTSIPPSATWWRAMPWWQGTHLGAGCGQVEGSCEHAKESYGTIKCREILEWLHNWKLFKNSSSPFYTYSPVSPLHHFLHLTSFSFRSSFLPVPLHTHHLLYFLFIIVSFFFFVYSDYVHPSASIIPHLILFFSFLSCCFSRPPSLASPTRFRFQRLDGSGTCFHETVTLQTRRSIGRIIKMFLHLDTIKSEAGDACAFWDAAAAGLPGNHLWEDLSGAGGWSCISYVSVQDSHTTQSGVL
jgi:hypothetical protein